jgi:hypothetical protein
LKEFAMFVSDSATSVFSRNPDEAEEDRIVRQAIAILEKRISQEKRIPQDGPKLLSPAAVYDYLRQKLIPEPHEVFSVIYLDSQQRVLAYEPLFKGSASGTAVYPRVTPFRAVALVLVPDVLALVVARPAAGRIRRVGDDRVDARVGHFREGHRRASPDDLP